MNFEELHNELNDFPDDLKYTDQRWEGALALIEANEAFVKRKKAVFFSSVGALIIAAFFFGNSFDDIAEYQPRTEQARMFNYSEVTDEVTEKELAEISKLSSFREVSKKPEVHAVGQSEPVNNGVLRSQNIATHNEQASKLTVKENHTNSSLDENEIPAENEVNVIAENQSSKIQESVTVEEHSLNANEADRLKLILDSKERIPVSQMFSDAESEKGEFSLTPVAIRTNFLTKTFKKSGLRNTNKILLGNSFVRYFKFLEVKVGVNPWADFGRSDLLGNYNPILGLAYEAPISKKLSWNVGAEYMNISGMNLSVSTENTSYRFGKESEITTVYTDKAHFANVPLGLALNVLPRVQLKTGVNTSMLIQTANTLEQRIQTHQSDEILSEEKTEGYKSSFSTMQFSASVGARYWVSGRNALQISFHKGLTDFSKNDAFLSDRADLTSRIEISINRVIR